MKSERTWKSPHVRKARRGGEREKWGTTKPKLLTLYVALTTHNSLPAASHLSHVGWFSLSFYYPWGKMGTTRSLHTCLTYRRLSKYLDYERLPKKASLAAVRCVITQRSWPLRDDTTQLRRRLSGVCLDDTNCEVLKKESPLFKPCFSFGWSFTSSLSFTGILTPAIYLDKAWTAREISRSDSEVSWQ